jgi:hypothetical protein
MRPPVASFAEVHDGRGRRPLDLVDLVDLVSTSRPPRSDWREPRGHDLVIGAPSQRLVDDLPHLMA